MRHYLLYKPTAKQILLTEEASILLYAASRAREKDRSKPRAEIGVRASIGAKKRSKRCKPKPQPLQPRRDIADVKIIARRVAANFFRL